MRRKAHGTSSHSEVLVTGNRGEIRKRNRKGINKPTEVSPSLDTKM